MVGKPRWLDTPSVDVYRVVRQRDGSFHILEHRDGRVEIYARLVGALAEERAEAIARDMNRREAAA